MISIKNSNIAPSIAQRRQEKIIALSLLIGAFIFYLGTLAPTVLWGDDAFLQRVAYEGVAPPNSPAHWLWLVFARLAVHLPFGDIAFRVNLVSAVAAATAVAVVYVTARSLPLSRLAAVLVALALAVSHTFWTHAVRAEVYTVFVALLALQLLLWFRWRPYLPWPMRLAMLLFGPLLLAHPMAVLLLPAWGWLLWRRRDWIAVSDLGWWTLAGMIGLTPFVLVILRQGAAPDLAQAIISYFTSSGANFAGSLFNFSWATLPRDLLLWLGLLGLQFAGPAGILIIIAAIRLPRWSGIVQWQVLGLLYLTGVAFAISYRVNDQYVFYLPSYLAIVFFAGLGWEQVTADLSQLSRPRAVGALMALVGFVPPLAYLLTAQLMLVLNLNPLHIRQLPGREPNRFFLWPAKTGYEGARTYGMTVLTALPANSLLIADYTPLETLLYLQAVEGLRPDVTLIGVGPDRELQPCLAGLPPERAIYFADNNPAYYDLSDLPAARLEPEGTIYRFLPTGGNSPMTP